MEKLFVDFMIKHIFQSVPFNALVRRFFCFTKNYMEIKNRINEGCFI